MTRQGESQHEIAVLRQQLLSLHERIAARYDLQRWHWTPQTTAFDICLGAILVQHTAWTNVEKALANLREAGVITLELLAKLPEEELAALVRPSGTPLTKARRLQSFARRVLERGGLDAVCRLSAEELRAFLLATHGIGPETADVICLYAARHPVVVHDAYTKRLFRRLGLGPNGDSYETWRSWLDAVLPRDGELRRVHHAGIVVHCKETCRALPKCHACPLKDDCAHSLSNTAAAAG